MAKFLRIEGTNTITWRLPAATDCDSLADRLETALEQGSVVRVAVEPQDNPLGTGTVLVHAGRVWSLVIVDRPEPDVPTTDGGA